MSPPLGPLNVPAVPMTMSERLPCGAAGVPRPGDGTSAPGAGGVLAVDAPVGVGRELGVLGATVDVPAAPATAFPAPDPSRPDGACTDCTTGPAAVSSGRDGVGALVVAAPPCTEAGSWNLAPSVAPGRSTRVPQPARDRQTTTARATKTSLM